MAEATDGPTGVQRRDATEDITSLEATKSFHHAASPPRHATTLVRRNPLGGHRRKIQGGDGSSDVIRPTGEWFARGPGPCCYRCDRGNDAGRSARWPGVS